MAVVKELIRTEENGTISFGDYEKNQKSKVSDYPHQGDMYKVKTFKEITKLERNGMFVYESVPGTTVDHLQVTERGKDQHERDDRLCSLREIQGLKDPRKL